MGLRDLVRRYRHIERYRQIATVLIKYGFGWFVKQIHLHSTLPISKRIIESKFADELDLSTEVRIRCVLEELGPTFIKFGQILSTRPDFIPKSLFKELEKLQDEVPPFGNPEDVIKRELGAPPEKLFASFEKKPVAAASVGQVHRAVLESGDIVAVKVQRPDIEKTVATDMEILADIAHLMEKHIPESRAYHPRAIVKDFARIMEDELDYTKEAQNMTRFHRNFSGDPMICIPKVYPGFSSRRVLTMEFIDGVQLDDLKKFRVVAEDSFKKHDARLKKTISGVETIRFNPFKGDGSGGNQSFATAFLNEEKNGVVISSMYGRERMSIFSKPVKNLTSEYELTSEEKEVLAKAQESIKKPLN